MNGNDKNSSVYSTSDIQKYLRGELSAPEMHQLELAALEDPLLSDALEGMAIHHSLPSPPSFRQDLGELQQRLDKRVGKQERKGLFFRSFWKAAAVLILLAGLGLTTYFVFFASLTRSRLAERRDAQPGSSPSVAATPATADSITLQNQEVTNHQPPAARADKSAIKDPQASGRKEGLPSREKQAAAAGNDQATISQADQGIAKKADRSPEPTAPGTTKATKQEEIADDKTTKLEKAAEVAASRIIVHSEVSDASLPTKTHSNFNSKRTDTTYVQGFTSANQTSRVVTFPSPTDQLVFTGKVIDQNNRPLSGAALYLAGNYLSNTTTDKNGYFSFKLPKNDSALKLTVAHVGYEQTSLGLSTDNRTGNIIQLQPQANAMNEVVVTGYGAKRKEILKNNSKPQKESLPTKAEPIIGWPAYESYLDINKKVVNPDSTLKGTETISFLVNKEGTLSSFKVEQSLSPAHDSAAIHLIRQGPSWKLLKGKRTRAWVTIPF